MSGFYWDLTYSRDRAHDPGYQRHDLDLQGASPPMWGWRLSRARGPLVSDAKKTHWKTYMDRDFLGACDLVGRGDVTVTIASHQQGEIAKAGTSKKERKGVITFKGSPKKWVVSTTNGKIIEGLYGEFVEDWIGKRITLYLTDTKMSGKPCKGVRVRPRIPGSKAADSLPPDAAPVEVHAELTGDVTPSDEYRDPPASDLGIPE